MSKVRWDALIVLGALAGIMAGGIYSHELVHTGIMEQFGCKETYIGLNGKNAYAQCLDVGRIETVEEKALHTQNEIFSYNTIVPTALLAGIFAFLLLKK